ncbi:MAG: phosphocholine cytidylyltransferase family protein [Myxococcota bacterium]|nr:phosphocholine cytidylyltransferase family protein [Myxococcota bacterium]
MAAKPLAAVILAAGMGTRLRGLFSDLPKGFVQIGEETLIERSLRLLGEHGIRRVLIVAGHLGDAYHDLAKARPEIRIIDNPAYAETGSMASLALALEEMDEDFLLLESDLFYEARALRALLEGDVPDVLLASGPTGATDEVWIESDKGRLTAMSKDPKELAEVSGELVGIMRVSTPLAGEWLAAYQDFVREHGHGRMAYETEGLVEVAGNRPVEVRLVPDLLWGEVDYEHHYLRVRDEIEPLCARRESERVSDPPRSE